MPALESQVVELTTPTAQKSLRPIIRALGRFNQFDPKMQVSTILALLEIAEGELSGQPVSVQQVEQRVGIKSGTASRNVSYWGEGHKEMTGGHRLVSIEFDPADRRRRSLSLTRKGKAFITTLLDDLG